MPGWDPVELEGPEWLDGEKARDDPEAGRGKKKNLFFTRKISCATKTYYYNWASKL